MKNYDEFIADVGQTPPCPQGVYANVKFRVAVRNLALPAAFTILFFVFATFFVMDKQGKEEEELAEYFAKDDEEVFMGGDFYSLLD